MDARHTGGRVPPECCGGTTWGRAIADGTQLCSRAGQLLCYVPDGMGATSPGQNELHNKTSRSMQQQSIR